MAPKRWRKLVSNKTLPDNEQMDSERVKNQNIPKMIDIYSVIYITLSAYVMYI